MIRDIVHNVSDTCLLFVSCNGWIILHLVVLQRHLYVEDRSKAVLFVVGN